MMEGGEGHGGDVCVCVCVLVCVCVTSAGQSHVLPCYHLHTIEKINKINESINQCMTDFEQNSIQLIQLMKHQDCGIFAE